MKTPQHRSRLHFITVYCTCTALSYIQGLCCHHPGEICEEAQGVIHSGDGVAGDAVSNDDDYSDSTCPPPTSVLSPHSAGNYLKVEIGEK